MHPIFKRLKNHFSLFAKSEKSHEELQNEFRRNYAKFRTLLTANNNALKAMAELEQALHGGQSYSMAFIRSRGTAIMVNVYKMLCQLIDISDGRYRNLEKSFDKIKARIENGLERRSPLVSGEWIIPLDQANRNNADLVGEKMANLGETRAIEGLQTPHGFIITASATRYFYAHNNIQSEIDRRLQMLDPDDLENLYKTSAEIQKIIVHSPLPHDLDEKIEHAYQQLEEKTSPGLKVAMRSSALGEDLKGVSFAGQYHSELNVDREFLGWTYKEIVASKYTTRAIVYRLKRGFRYDDITMCVGCLAMVDAVLSGIVYSRDPSFFDSSWVSINVSSGTGKSVVDGTVPTDLFLVTKKKPYRILEKKIRRFCKLSTAHFPENNPDAYDGLTLTDNQAKELARLATLLEKHFGLPQDIEWSIDREGEIQILQSRPLSPSPQIQQNKENNKGQNREALLHGGITGSSGIACGRVFHVRSTVDMLQFPSSAVLVVEHPLPAWAPLLHRAVALVAETGSEAGHLATVAREFALPALLSVPDATHVLAEGQMVTVDAANCEIYKGCRKELLATAAAPPDLMAGSPVQKTLREVLQWITPLNLTDPSSPYFKPSWCETLHDITRFCHEKAVIEMFSFPERHRYSERAAKRMIGKVPMEWWVIDLADGFSQDFATSSETIQIGDIVSIPMLAVWEGMSAFPWQGPPPVNVRGMGAVLFQSTMNPWLDPAVASPMTSRNYFLISKNFCNLSVRLGYHFAMLEAYLSTLRTESYVSFSFKGGAADDRRRKARIDLLADILDRFSFRIDREGDTLTARIEKKSMEILSNCLKLLGYLIIHSRQIDMAMGNQQSMTEYRDKFLSEINLLLGGCDTADCEGK